jgi:hypothetical protein
MQQNEQLTCEWIGRCYFRAVKLEVGQGVGLDAFSW